MKVEFNNCVCSNWSTISPVIPKNKFIGWGHKGIAENCYDYVTEQLRVAGQTVKSPGWRDWSKKELTMSNDIYQLFLEIDIAGMKKGVQKDQFKKGIEYLKGTIKKGTPVMAGVDDGFSKSNTDKTTEHFITIVGMGKDKEGSYFLFYDNAVSDKAIGASSENKLYCDCKKSLLSGKGDLNNEYIQINTKKKKYIITQIRETK